MNCNSENEDNIDVLDVTDVPVKNFLNIMIWPSEWYNLCNKIILSYWI